MTDLMILNKLAELRKDEFNSDTILGVTDDGKEIKANEIRSLNLSNTDIKVLPKTIGLLVGLQFLDVSDTQITSLTRSIMNLKNLQMLDISGTQITTLPRGFGRLENLQVLNASGTQLTFLPESIRYLSHLQTLNISGTHLKALSESIGYLRSLQTLNISDTPISALPSSIRYLSRLQTLDVSGTQLTTIPENIKYLNRLQTLDISDSQLTNLPESIRELNCLQILDVSRTQLSFLPWGIGGVEKIQLLDVNNAQHTKKPLNKRYLKNLQFLNISGTLITSLPANIRYLNHLQTLDASGTQLKTLPASIRDLNHLQTLNVRGTLITTLPESIGRLNSLQNLDISGTQLKNLPKSIEGLDNLQTLDVSGTLITNLPENIGKLKKLLTLDVSCTQLTALPENIEELENLETLDINGTKITTLPEGIGKLKKLHTLNARGTQLRYLPENIGRLSKLQTLNVSETRLISLPEILRNLYNLQSLDVSSTELTILPDIIGSLASLQTLIAKNTQLTYLPKSIDGLKKLQTLDISDTQLTNLPENIGKLNSLQKLEAKGIQHITLPESIRSLNKLKWLNLSEAEVENLNVLSGLEKLTSLNLQSSKTTALPESILDLNLSFITDKYNGSGWCNHSGIFIHNLILTDQPIGIFNQSKEMIRAYLREKDLVPVNECKVIFLGDAESGKTHSIKRLLKNGAYLNEKEFKGESTPGIETTVSKTKLEESNIVINYWDFGGQEIQHSMHRVFLTERTVYVVFLNARQDDQMDERARYWLENIKAFAPDAPVLVAINKIDENNQPRFNQTGIIGTYGNQVKNVIRLSAKLDKPQDFLDKLQGNINSIIKELPTVSKKIPKSWKALMESIRSMSKHYLTTREFKDKCVSFNIKDYKNIHDDLVDLFQEIGVSFYYKERHIANYMLLNPRWLLNALYTIVTNGKTVSENGVITHNDLYDLLKEDSINEVKIKRVHPNLRYEGSEVNYILGVIRKFRLSYRLDDETEFFPMLCDGNEKKTVKEVPEDALHYIFRYTYLPTNVMHRLVVDMRSDIDYNYVWYTGAVFRNDSQKQTAYVHSLGNDLHIYVYGEEEYYNLNEYLTPISDKVRNINSVMGLSATELLTLSKNGIEAEIPLKEVRGNLRNGITKVYNAKLDDIISYEKLAHRYPVNRLETDDILNHIIQALKAMQNDNTYYRCDQNSKELEISRNRFVSAQLIAAGYACSDEQLGGVSGSGITSGKRDIVIKDNSGQDALIYEGLNLTSMDKSYINSHLNKLMVNYNPLGLSQGILVVYLECERAKYRRFIDNYRNHISENAPEPWRCIGEPKVIPSTGQLLTCFEMNYGNDGLLFKTNHIIVRVAPS